MGHSNIRIKARRRKVATLAAQSRKYTVKNTKKGISEVIDHKVFYEKPDVSITCPFTGHVFVPTNPHPIPSQRFGVTITGYDWVEPEGKLWKNPENGYKQTKSLRKKKVVKKPVFEKIGNKRLFVGYKTVTYKSEYPNYTSKKMSREEYIEKYINYKTAKWEKLHPKPILEDDKQKDIFESQYLPQWETERTNAVIRIRDFVVSVYDKLNLYTRHANGGVFTHETKIAELQDKTGVGNEPANIKPDSPLYKKAEKLVIEKAEKDNTVTSGRLESYDKKKGKIIVPNKKPKTMNLKDRMKKAA